MWLGLGLEPWLVVRVGVRMSEPAELEQGQVGLGEVILIEQLHVSLGRLDTRLVRGWG